MSKGVKEQEVKKAAPIFIATFLYKKTQGVEKRTFFTTEKIVVSFFLIVFHCFKNSFFSVTGVCFLGAFFHGKQFSS